MRSTADAAARRYRRTGDRDELNRCVEALRPLVHEIARIEHRRLPHHELAELEQIAMVALLETLPSFDPDRDVPVEAFVRPRVRGSILDEARKGSPSSRERRRRRRAIEEAQVALLLGLGRMPTDAELAGACSLTVVELRAVVDRAPIEHVGSLDAAAERRGDIAASPLSGPPAVLDPEEVAVNNDRARALGEALAQLPDRQRAVVVLYYFEGRSHPQIAVQLGIDASTSSRLLGRALGQLRQIIEPADLVPT